MKSTKNNNRPDSQTEWFRIVARKFSAQELEELRGGTLFINPGERIHKVVILEFDDGNTARVLSKMRDKDGLINVLAKNKRPTGKETVMKADKWVTVKDYEKLITALKKDEGVREILNTGNGEMYKDFVCATDFIKTENTTGTDSED